PYEPTLRLLRHPLGPGLSGEAWERARKRHPAGASAWQNAGVDLGSLALPPRARRGEYVDRLRTLLGEGPGRKARRYAAEAIALAHLLNAFAELEEPR